jgi:oligopeptidase A
MRTIDMSAATIPAETAANPLLIGKGLPPFEQIQTEQVVPAITQLLAESEERLTQLEADLQPTWTSRWRS